MKELRITNYELRLPWAGLIMMLLLLFASDALMAQHAYFHPKRFGPDSWTATYVDQKFADGSIEGKILYEGSWEMWFPCAADSGSTVGAVRGTAGWALDATNKPTLKHDILGTHYGFDADGTGTDQYAYLTFTIPSNYDVDSMEFYLYWYHLDDNGGETDTVKWQGAVQAVGAGEDLYAAGTAITAVYVTCTLVDSALYVTTINPEVEAIASGDLVTFKIGTDISACQLDSSENAYLIGVRVVFQMKDDD
jgi:hypothetical protein